MRVSLGSVLVLAAALLTAAVAILAAMWVARRKRDQDLRAHGSPLVVAGAMGAGSLAIVQEAHRSSPSSARVRTPSQAPEILVVPRSGPVTMVEDPVTATTGQFVPGDVAAEVVHGHSLRFHRPPDGTLQFFPGSFQVVGGPDAGHELRFVRPAPGDSPAITFGRKEGPPYRHVQLLEPTVSRTHARLDPEEGGWRLTNLSRTNPVVLNGSPLDGVQASHLLRHDDLVEMGALVFRYRSGEAAPAPGVVHEGEERA